MGSAPRIDFPQRNIHNNMAASQELVPKNALLRRKKSIKIVNRVCCEKMWDSEPYCALTLTVLKMLNYCMFDPVLVRLQSQVNSVLLKSVPQILHQNHRIILYSEYIGMSARCRDAPIDRPGTRVIRFQTISAMSGWSVSDLSDSVPVTFTHMLLTFQ